jgi:succinoglycan biosynthesis protein ExoA
MSMTDATPTISIVVPCYNERDHIASCLHSILAQDSPPGGFEVIVADGMSTDGTREVLMDVARKDPRLRVIDNPGRIVSSGLNTAIRAAQGTVIIRMDAHTSYAGDYVCQCLAVLQETGADDVGGPWVAEGVGFVSRAIAAAFQSPFSGGGPRGHNPRYEGVLDTVYLGCWPREIFARIGLFDEELVRNQDDELCLRLTRAGGKIWQSPRIKSWYRPRESLGALFRQYRQYGYWKVRVIQKHRLPASGRHLVPGTFAFLLLVLPLASLWWRPAAWSWLGLVIMYAVCNVAASFLAARQHGWTLLLLLPLVFACYHFGYGYGFLSGVWNFAILRRRPPQAYSALTRTAADHRSEKEAARR